MHYWFSLFLLTLQSPRSTARSTVQATCAAGRPVSWGQRERVRQTNTIAPTSAAWSLWDESTPTRLCRLMEKFRLNPLSSSHAMPWMANSLLLIKGRAGVWGQCHVVDGALLVSVLIFRWFSFPYTEQQLFSVTFLKSCLARHATSTSIKMIYRS